MSGLPFYKRYPSNAISGMQALTLEERGAYNTLIDLIYDNGGPIRDDEQTIRSYMNCDVRVWRRVRARLVAMDKIRLTADGKIANGRASVELGMTAPSDAKNEVDTDLAPTSGELTPNLARTYAELTPEVPPKSDELSNEINKSLAGAHELETRSQRLEEETHIRRVTGARDRLDQIREAAGDALASMAVCPAIASLHALTILTNADPPCEWETDIVPAVISAAAWHRGRDGPGSMRSWTTAARIAVQNRDARLTPRPVNDRSDPIATSGANGRQSRAHANFAGAALALSRRRAPASDRASDPDEGGLAGPDRISG